MKKLKVTVDGKKYDVSVDELGGGKFNVQYDNKTYAVETEEENQEGGVVKKSKSSTGGSKSINSPITGTIGKINTGVGKAVKNGEVLLTLIAMKMENEIKAEVDGKVKSINVKVGQNVEVGELLVELE